MIENAGELESALALVDDAQALKLGPQFLKVQLRKSSIVCNGIIFVQASNAADNLLN